MTIEIVGFPIKHIKHMVDLPSSLCERLPGRVPSGKRLHSYGKSPCY